jgi:hypothetical protein
MSCAGILYPGFVSESWTILCIVSRLKNEIACFHRFTASILIVLQRAWLTVIVLRSLIWRQTTQLKVLKPVSTAWVPCILHSTSSLSPIVRAFDVRASILRYVCSIASAVVFPGLSRSVGSTRRCKGTLAHAILLHHTVPLPLGWHVQVPVCTRRSSQSVSSCQHRLAGRAALNLDSLCVSTCSIIELELQTRFCVEL